MTTHSERQIVCACGHTGSVHLSENDYPFGGLYEEYSLEGFSGASVTITSYADAPENILTALNAKCPQCAQTGMVSYTPRA